MDKPEMMKVIIEETITQEFTIPLEFESKVEEMYRAGKLVVDQGEKQAAKYMIEYADGEETGWCDIT